MFPYQSVLPFGSTYLHNLMGLPYFNYPNFPNYSPFSNIYVPNIEPMMFFNTQPDLTQTIKAQAKDEVLINQEIPVTFLEEIKKEKQPREKKIKKIYPKTKDPFRNIYTNITNLIMNFMVCPRKIGKILYNVDHSLVEDKLLEFCHYAKSVRKYYSAYFNPPKLRRLFAGKEIPFYDEHLHRLLRIVVKMILEDKITLCLITSKRLSPYLTLEHLKERRQFLRILRTCCQEEQKASEVGQR